MKHTLAEPVSSDLGRELVGRVATYDHCWMDGRTDDLREFLHPDVVLTGPNWELLARGVDAAVESYRIFLAEARVHGFSAFDYVVSVADRTAVVTYRWTIDYETKGRRRIETGRELMVWVRSGARWLVAWRSQRVEP